MSRWVRVSADIFEHELFAQAELSEREAWLWLVMHSRAVGDRAEIETTTHDLAKAWHWASPLLCGRFLRKLEKANMAAITITDASAIVNLAGSGEWFEIQGGGWGGITSLRFPRRSKPFVSQRAQAAGWGVTRAFVFARDGHRCTYCGDDSGPFECDHVQPVSRGGSNDPKNLTTACKPCNASKGAKLLKDWLQ